LTGIDSGREPSFQTKLIITSLTVDGVKEGGGMGDAE